MSGMTGNEQAAKQGVDQEGEQNDDDDDDLLGWLLNFEDEVLGQDQSDTAGHEKGDPIEKKDDASFVTPTKARGETEDDDRIMVYSPLFGRVWYY
jgi:hypothetical protein